MACFLVDSGHLGLEIVESDDKLVEIDRDDLTAFFLGEPTMELLHPAMQCGQSEADG